jgi:predicted secreted protein
MYVFSGFVLFMLIWWTAIFVTLPFASHPSKDVTLGHAPSAPHHHNLKKKLVATTLIALVLTIPANYALQDLLKSMREDAKVMAIEDQKK